tara:strand:+ start:726 stop:974 length:249 start_codon:yes stop_codon:yes gene_type:complete
MNDWLTDIYNLGKQGLPANEAICVICKRRKQTNTDDVYPICIRCQSEDSRTRASQDKVEYEDSLYKSGPHDKDAPDLGGYAD